MTFLPPTRLVRTTAVIATAAMVLSACTIPAPPTSATPSPLSAALAAISVLPAETRVAEVVRTEVMRQLATATAPAAVYELAIATEVDDLRGPSTAPAGTVVVVTDFALTATATREVVLSFGVRNEERYPVSPDPAVTARARRAAEDRAALDAAALVVLHVAGTMETLLPTAVP